MASIIGAFVTFTLVVVLIMLLRPFSIMTGLVDRPNARSSHMKPTPLVGGLAIFVAVSIGYVLPAIMGPLPITTEIVSYFAAGLLLVAIGVVDDYRPLPTSARFVAQIFASLIMIYGGGVVLTDLGGMGFSGQFIYLGWLSVPFTVFATLGVINALNMCDGLDGLSGTLSLVSIAGLLIASYLGGAVTEAYMLLLLAVSVVGFLLFNWRLPGRDSAVIFMGDAGSMFLGLSLTWFAISLSQGAGRIITPAAALWFLMLPIFDTIAMIVRRVKRKQSPFAPDKEHIHHVFVMSGFTVNETVIMMAAGAMIGAGIGLLSLDLDAPEFSIAGLFVIAGLLYMWMMIKAWKVMLFIERSFCRRRGDRRAGFDRRQFNDSSTFEEDRRLGNDRRQSQRRRLIDGEKPIEVDEQPVTEVRE